MSVSLKWIILSFIVALVSSTEKNNNINGTSQLLNNNNISQPSSSSTSSFENVILESNNNNNDDNNNNWLWEAQNISSLTIEESSSSSFITNDNSCSAIVDCHQCSNTRLCHWCDFDSACHTMGSIHGCSWGSNCQKDDDNKNKENSTCSAHTTCSECALSSRLCHWCEFDNACHAVGSRFGCVSGVNCYSNDRCRRKEPEKFDHYIFSTISFVPLMILLCIVMICLIACTCCFYKCCGIKRVHNVESVLVNGTSTTVPLSSTNNNSPSPGDLETNNDNNSGNVGITTNNNNNNNNNQGQNNFAGRTPPTSPEDDDANIEMSKTEQNNSIAAAAAKQDTHQQQQQQQQQQTAQALSQDANEAVAVAEPQTSYRLMEENDNNNNNNNSSNDIIIHPETTPLLEQDASLSLFTRPSETTGSRTYHVRRLSTICSLCYYVTVFIVACLAVSVVFFYPSKPKYSVCNDSVAWKSIIESIASFKVDTSFEILMSLKNPNHIDIVLEQATGGFAHDGQSIGTFEIPPVKVAAMSVTDLMLIAQVTPNRQQAWSLVQDYYHGKLVLDVDFEATISVPTFFGYSKSISTDGIVVNVNEASDRSLCACPTW